MVKFRHSGRLPSTHQHVHPSHKKKVRKIFSYMFTDILMANKSNCFKYAERSTDGLFLNKVMLICVQYIVLLLKDRITHVIIRKTNIFAYRNLKQWDLTILDSKSKRYTLPKIFCSLLFCRRKGKSPSPDTLYTGQLCSKLFVNLCLISQQTCWNESLEKIRRRNSI